MEVKEKDDGEMKGAPRPNLDDYERPQPSTYRAGTPKKPQRPVLEDGREVVEQGTSYVVTNNEPVVLGASLEIKTGAHQIVQVDVCRSTDGRLWLVKRVGHHNAAQTARDHKARLVAAVLKEKEQFRDLAREVRKQRRVLDAPWEKFFPDVDQEEV